MKNSTFDWQFHLVHIEKGTNKEEVVFVLIITVITVSLLVCAIADTYLSV